VQTGLTSSLTVEVTQCDAEFLTWFLNNTQVRYTLESYKDYAPQPAAPDASCPTIGSAQGVGPKAVDNRWHFTQVQ